jgi:hypothetical protein
MQSSLQELTFPTFAREQDLSTEFEKNINASSTNGLF